MNQSVKPSVLYIDDNSDNRELLKFVFEYQGFNVKASETVAEGLYQAKQKNFSAIILDNRLGDMSGLEVCRSIRSSDPLTPIIFYSGEGRESEIEKAFAAGANEYLIKPNDFDKLTDTVSKLVNR